MHLRQMKKITLSFCVWDASPGARAAREIYRRLLWARTKQVPHGNKCIIDAKVSEQVVTPFIEVQYRDGITTQYSTTRDTTNDIVKAITLRTTRLGGAPDTSTD